MAGGLAALLDDVALIARAAAASVDDVAAATAKTTAKAAGVVIDDAAVTPRFVEGVTPARELPIIWKITKGSLFNKFIIILPIILLLNTLAPWLLTPILMLGGAYLCFEGAEKVWELVSGHQEEKEEAVGQQDEKTIVRGAITTDLILSAEIMVISLNEVADQPIWFEAGVLLAVGLAVTIGVYGAVALLVKMDDLGMSLATKDSTGAKKFGRTLVTAMPKILHAISLVGMFAMLWVGGHILVQGLYDLNLWQWPHHFIHDMTHHVEHLGKAITWLVETFFSMVFGLIVGGIIALIMHFIPRKKSVQH